MFLYAKLVDIETSQNYYILKSVGNLIFQLQYASSSGRSGASCTDRQQKWNKGTMKNLEPKRLNNISFKRKQPSSKFGEDAENESVVRETLPDQPVYITREDFVRDVERSSVADLFNLPGSLLNRCYKTELPCAVATTPTVHSEHSVELSCKACTDFYNNFVLLKSNDALESKTQGQADSVVWRDSRRVRITASTAKKVPVRATTDSNNFLREHLHPSFRGNWATRHGQESEPKALETLRDMGIHLSSRGTVVSTEEPWLSASPDAVTDDGRLVEVKCPIIQDDEGITHFRERFSTMQCDVVLVDGKPVLQHNGPRGYYMQVQLTMFCTGLRKCVFFVWSQKGHLLVDVDFNEEYVHSLIMRLKKFYFLTMLPRLADDYNEGRLKLCREYKEAMSKSK